MRKAIFLDRDGTINVEREYTYRIEDFVYEKGVIEALLLLQHLGYQLVIVTNQSGIARGYYTEEDFQYLNNWMLSDLKKRGIEIAGVYYCPHHPEGKVRGYAIECKCRKPATGLFWQAQEELHIGMKDSYAIGDKVRDLSICNESDVKGILLDKTVYGVSRFSLKNPDKKIWKCADLLVAAKLIMKENLKTNVKED